MFLQRRAGMPIPLQKHIVYGPVRSRRLGRSLGVNLLPHDMKVCNMNCAYCQYGWTRDRRERRRGSSRWPTPAHVQAAVAARLRQAADERELIDRITVAGHGEPTLHPEFEDIAERLCRLRDAAAPAIRLAILSNSTTAGWEDVRRGLALFDERHMKLDAGDPVTCARINGPGLSIGGIVDGLRALPQIIVQSMFVGDATGSIGNVGEGAVREWLTAIEQIQPLRVEIYTLDRPPAMAELRPAATRRLREIAEQVHAAGIPAHVIVPRDRRKSTIRRRSARRSSADA